ncbi:MAG: 16S rRNA (guanine(966)-N(2))-methyltransferase RsmD [Acidobacteriota bacterium]|nr:16S rRNA (guanine(966)-N(2))-methyltransferase RsmD [Acidobacteriota bacterium]
MRVIAGKFRSRALDAPPGADVRPTSDKLRGTLFNVLTAAVPLEGTVWLDVYAGSGAVGIEALSRGARQVYFVESARGAVTVIRKNLKSLQVESGWQIIEQPAVKALRQLDAEAVSADVIFLDPPYDDAEAYEQALGFLSQSRLLKPETIVVAEHEKHFDPGAVFVAKSGALTRYRELKQGDAVLSFYRLR